MGHGRFLFRLRFHFWESSQKYKEIWEYFAGCFLTLSLISSQPCCKILLSGKQILLPQIFRTSRVRDGAVFSTFTEKHMLILSISHFAERIAAAPFPGLICTNLSNSAEQVHFCQQMDRGGKNRPWTSSYSFPPQSEVTRERGKNKNRCVSGISSSRLEKCAIGK